jgi:hypothetical protein
MLLAFVAIAAIGVAAYYVLQEVGFSSDARQASDAVRID